MGYSVGADTGTAAPSQVLEAAEPERSVVVRVAGRSQSSVDRLRASSVESRGVDACELGSIGDVPDAVGGEPSHVLKRPVPPASRHPY
jgi:hypothetical protein